MNATHPVKVNESVVYLLSNRYKVRRMMRVLTLITAPTKTWEKIYQAQKSFIFLLVFLVLPLLVLSSAVEAHGLVHWGKYRPGEGRIRKFSPGEMAIFEAGQFVLSLAIVFAGSWLVKTLGETFHGRHTYTQTFTLVAYALGPLFILRVLDAFSSIPAWVPWVLGIIFAVRLLYYGIPRIMQPDPPHTFGLYLMSSLLLAFMIGIVGLVVHCYLIGAFPRLEAAISDGAAKLPF
jgi:hypothetical protein